MGCEAQDDGRIPFRVRIGVTGHRVLPDEDALFPLIREQVRTVVGLFSGKSTPARLAVVSQLAEGADRLVPRAVRAEAAERGEEARLECVLPLPREQYVEVQKFSPASKSEFDDLLERATVVHKVDASSSSTSHAEAYRAAGQLLVARCDVLIALWDGRPSRGGGGTAELLASAAACSKPCIWIESEGSHKPRHNLNAYGCAFYEEVAARAQPEPPIQWSPMDHPASTTQLATDAFRQLDRFNSGSHDPTSSLRGKGLAPWVAAPYSRASALAERFHRRFQWSARLIALMAAAAAAMLAIGLTYGDEAPGWAWAEALLLAAALVCLLAVKKIGFHQRWLCYRFLAERLRSAHFLSPIGIDVLRQARLEDVYSGTESTGWLMRAFEEVWDRRPRHPLPLASRSPTEQAHVKEQLTEEWIGKQIAYHERSVKRHRKWHFLQSLGVLMLFVGTIVFAVLHALHAFEHAPVLFGIILPAAAASLGVMLTVEQHEALSTRSTRMRSDLAVIQRDLRTALPDQVHPLSAEADRVIAQETGTWFGSMWFLDIEHP